MIGRLPDTLHDRAFVITMKRKLRHEEIAKLPKSFTGVDLRRKAQRWAIDNIEAFRHAAPLMPHGLNDRAEDNCSPLLAMADLAGGHWPDTARKAAALLGAGGDTDESAATILLEDIRGIFATRGTDRISTKDLLSALVALEERPWADYRRGHPINSRQLAGMLGRFGVSSGTIRLLDGSTPKGYHLGAFGEVFTRYLPDPPSQIRHNATGPVNTERNGDLTSATTKPCGGSENTRIANTGGPCGVVADKTGRSAKRRWTI
jgi:putative DNA primase/helicase